MNPLKQRIRLAQWIGSVHVDNFLEDLNAVHCVEGKLRPDQCGAYLKELTHRVWKDDKDEYWTTGHRSIEAQLIHATAAQRCEALLRTLGLWEDGE